MKTKLSTDTIKPWKWTVHKSSGAAICTIKRSDTRNYHRGIKKKTKVCNTNSISWRVINGRRPIWRAKTAESRHCVKPWHHHKRLQNDVGLLLLWDIRVHQVESNVDEFDQTWRAWRDYVDWLGTLARWSIRRLAWYQDRYFSQSVFKNEMSDFRSQTSINGISRYDDGRCGGSLGVM